jgi:CMP-N,N'-diacetyllegionaminic acid synthase
MKKIYCLVCCRGGSKGLKNKNISKFHGKPLIYWIYQEIKKTNIFHKIILSTDSQKIAKIGAKIGFEVDGLRPNKLATDKSNVFETHKYEFKKRNINDQNSLACVVNNNPFISSDMIKKTFYLYKKNNFKYIVHLAKEINYDQIFYRQCFKKNNKLIHHFKKKLINSKINRNQITKAFFNLGDIRWAKINLLSNFVLYNKNIAKHGNLFFPINKFKYIDINNYEDLKNAKKIFNKK